MILLPYYSQKNLNESIDLANFFLSFFDILKRSVLGCSNFEKSNIGTDLNDVRSGPTPFSAPEFHEIFKNVNRSFLALKLRKLCRF